MTTTVVNNSVFRAFFEKQRLTGPNFIDWHRNLRIVLSVEDKLPYLEQPIPAMPVPPAEQVLPPDVLNTHTAWVKASKEIVGLMLMTIDPDIQKNLEQLGAYDMLKELKMLYAQQAEQELLQTVREFHACKQEEGQSEYDRIGQNYNMHGMGKTVTELHAMLKLHEQTLPKKEAAPALHAIRVGKVKKKHKNKKPQLAARGNNQGKRKSKLAYAPKPKIPSPPKKDNLAKDAICHHCGDVGHWKRNCPQYLAELLKNKKLSQGASILGLRGSRRLKPRALSLYVGDGHRAAVEAIGSYHLCLPSGLVLVLHNCHYAPSITRGIISVSRLKKVYFTTIPRDGLYEIKMSGSNTNFSSMYAVSNKRAKLKLDSSLLWHCRLGHISKKCIEKLQHDGLLNSFDIESLGKCVSCMSRKMARKPYSHQVERAKDLLGLIHTDVYGPFRIVSRQGANYFVTFTNDFTRVFGSSKGRIIAHHTPPYTPQHNRVSERRNRTLLDMVRSMMSQTTLPKSFWDYAFESAARILNMVPTKKALVKRDTLTKPDKLEPRSFKCIFIGYPKETMGYSFYNPSENKVFVARNAELFESNLIDQEASGSLEDLEIIQEEDTNPSLDISLNHEEDDQEIDEP
ncbi:zinc finger, CCHC-type containing protein [Tanacetum coccineum]|uniref:Zinc finger, CCHC-type containing protein n=1 Tax=Tanacetum coccineum TaxID=301880 RepID=A0ABQ4Y9G9_9ASTR